MAPINRIANPVQKLRDYLDKETTEEQFKERNVAVNRFVLEHVYAIFEVLPKKFEIPGKVKVEKHKGEMLGGKYITTEVTDMRTKRSYYYFRKLNGDGVEEDYLGIVASDGSKYVLRSNWEGPIPQEFASTTDMETYRNLGHAGQIENMIDETLLPICQKVYPEGFNWNDEILKKAMEVLEGEEE